MNQFNQWLVRLESKYGSSNLTAYGALILGLLYGLMHAEPQIAVEHAQTLAGIVEYPDSNPQGMYYKKAWNLINQLSAIALYLGMSEWALSVVISCIGGSLFFAGLTLFSYSLSKHSFLSLMLPLVVIWTGVAGAYPGLTYPILMPGAYQTHGFFGLTIFVLMLGLLGCGYRRTTLFLVAIAPALHFSWGIFIDLIFLLSVIFNMRHLLNDLRKLLPWLLVGYTVCGISLLVWFSQSSGINLKTENAAQVLSISINHWDVHRRQLELGGEPILLKPNIRSPENLRTIKQQLIANEIRPSSEEPISLEEYSVPRFVDSALSKSWPFHPVVLTSILCISWLVILRNAAFEYKRLVFTALLLSGIAGTAFSFIMFFPINLTPPILWSLMPQRWPNINIICFLPLLIATIGQKIDISKGWVIITVVVAILLFKFRDMFPYYMVWFFTFIITSVGLLHSPDSAEKQAALRWGLLDILIFFVPVLSLFSYIFLVYYDAPFWHWSNISFGFCTATLATFLGPLIGRKIASRWLSYTSIMFLASGFSVLILYGVGLYQNLDLILMLSSIGYIVLGIVIFVYRHYLIALVDAFLENYLDPIRTLSSRVDSWKLLRTDRLGKRLRFTAAFTALACASLLIGANQSSTWNNSYLADLTDNIFWTEVKDTEGMLLTGPGLKFIQFRTRRPVLLESGILDWIPYVLEAAPAVELILSDVYGIEYSNPPSGQKRGGVHAHWGKEVWLQRTTHDWIQLKNQFSINSVLVRDDWDLNLTLQATGAGYTLYNIP